MRRKVVSLGLKEKGVLVAWSKRASYWSLDFLMLLGFSLRVLAKEVSL